MFLGGIKLSDLNDAVNVVMTGVNGAFSLFERIPQEWVALILGVVFFAFFSRLIIAPLFGGSFHRGTDSVRKADEEE